MDTGCEEQPLHARSEGFSSRSSECLSGFSKEAKGGGADILWKGSKGEQIAEGGFWRGFLIVLGQYHTKVSDTGEGVECDIP